MNAIKNTVVSFRYRLKDEQGNLIEASPSEPSIYLHGYHQIMPLIENALEGKTAGDKVSVFIVPEKAYGKWDKKYVQILPRNQFDQKEPLQIGMKIYPEANKDFIMKIIKIEGENVTVDANHPLAGLTLLFEIEVLAVREASPEEITKKEVCLKLKI